VMSNEVAVVEEKLIATVGRVQRLSRRD